ncbi:MAG: lytic transglycosylase domain-containing protein [Anaerolineae bacterium]|nr:lytic transglycosylase domain-containing protein [Anaerolineae bacterium]
MPRARTSEQVQRQTAALQQDGSGCLSVYSLPLFAVALITCLLTALAFYAPTPTSASPIEFQSPIQNTTTIMTSASTRISPIFTREVQHWSDDIVRWAGASSLDPTLVAVVMHLDSCGDPRAVSSAGAAGLFQVMPFHFQSTENPFNPETNAFRGLDYLARSLAKANGNVRLALAGYNGGIGVITRGEWSWSAQTLRYVYFGAPIYEDARNGLGSSPTLQEWYQKYGASLCRQASQRLGLNP